ncbi:helix-turn-helix domain-containing protein [Mycolicibacterium austroafricanum]|uniref:helix-turn-helix domain-containing protein n=1 Tax=Mycolicibacterium austroafricanum TaxID=39687 RepID=UPI00105749B9|nr:helix-turn-helix domain-containing protein [Mycolicibacterium austroafricanum]
MSEVQVVEPTEVLVPLSEQDATRLDKRLRLMAGTARENFEKVGRLLDEAKRGQVHEVLGFKSWTAYVADAVGGQLQLSGDSRQAMVQMLAGEGMSVRAIATATGVSKSTVDRDLAQVSQSGTPGGPDASESGVPQRDTSDVVDELADGDDALADELTKALNDTGPATVTGIDGKTYTKPKRKPKPKKEPEPEPAPEPEPVSTRKVQIPTAYRESIKALSTVACSMRDLVDDPRWSRALGRFTDKDRAELDGNIAVLQTLRAAMGELHEVTPMDTTPEEKTA